jgi:hypothetical protein
MTVVASSRSAPRAPWADVRLLLGILLVAASIAGVWFVVTAARQTAPVYAAAGTIVQGQAITAEDLRVVEVALGQVAGAYLTPAALEGDLVATRTVAAGELVPQSAVGEAAGSRTTSVVVRSAVDVPASVEPGAVVEVWAAPQIERGVYDTPRILVADATVVEVTRDDSMMGGAEAALEVVISRADVAEVLAALADGDAISVIPTAGSGR